MKIPSRRLRTPTIFQMEAAECGAASLGIVLAYYGRIVPLEELRVRCGVSRDGSKASNILKAARYYGLIARGFSKDPEALLTLPLPMMVFWNFNHFLVVEGFGRKKVFLNDPATGPRWVTWEEFDQCFTGVVLLFEKGMDFQSGGEKRSVASTFGRRLAGSRDALLYLFVMSLFAVITGLLIPIFSQIFVDNILIGGMTGWFMPLITGMAVTTLVRCATSWLQQHYLARFEIKLAICSASAFFRHVLHLPMDFFFQRSAGEISSRITINNRIAELLSGNLATNVLNLFLVLFYALVMFQFDKLLTWVGIGIAFLNIALLRVIARKRVDGNRQLLQERGKLMGTTISGLLAIESLKAGGSEDDFFAKWSGQFAKMLKAEQVLGRYTTVLNTVSRLLVTLNEVTVLILGGVRVMNGHMTMGMLVAYQSLMASFMHPVSELVALGGYFQELEGDMNRLDDVMRYPAETPNPVTEEQTSTYDGTKLRGSLELKGVTFGYSRLEPPLIEDFSLKLEPGKRVAFVGGSGSGKSTLVKIISGLLVPWEGEILFDGRSRAGLPRDVMTNSLAMVDQDICLFEGTIRENLALWDETITEAAVIQAAKDACIHESIASRSGGYDAHIDEAGRNFSGGERQRLEIARALALNPAILILDEATSALDPITEARVDGNIRLRGCTCVIVAHRLSAVRDCDEIIVLDRGKVAERGTHEILMAHEDFYAGLVKCM